MIFYIFFWIFINTKFSEFRVNNKAESKKHYIINKENNDKNENKENQSNNIMRKKSTN